MAMTQREPVSIKKWVERRGHSRLDRKKAQMWAKGAARQKVSTVPLCRTEPDVPMRRKKRRRPAANDGRGFVSQFGANTLLKHILFCQLAYSGLDFHRKGVPMASRNLPASFFNAAASAPSCAGLDLYDYDPWHQHYAGYGHAAHRHAAEYHAAAAHHNMAAAGYSGLLLGRGSLHAQYKPVEWGHAHHAHAHAQHLDPSACSPYSYPPPGM
ncbi:unnamed protein product [Leptosia nina]|uniref:Uncharacterized protein n=1 Tax=Leptosia nina TaxID=320188 RepID=A0AAV1JWI5_9NEOP